GAEGINEGARVPLTPHHAVSGGGWRRIPAAGPRVVSRLSHFPERLPRNTLRRAAVRGSALTRHYGQANVLCCSWCLIGRKCLLYNLHWRIGRPTAAPSGPSLRRRGVCR